MNRLIGAGLVSLVLGCTGKDDTGTVRDGGAETGGEVGTYITNQFTDSGTYSSSGGSGTGTSSGGSTVTSTGGTSGTTTGTDTGLGTSGTTGDVPGYCVFPTNLQCNDLSDCTYDAFVVGEAAPDSSRKTIALTKTLLYLGNGEGYEDTELVDSDGNWRFGTSVLSFGAPQGNLVTAKLSTTGDLNIYKPKECDGFMILCGNDMGTDDYGFNYPTTYMAATDGATLRGFARLLDDGVGGWDGMATCYDEKAGTVSELTDLTALYGSSAGK